MFVFSVRFVVFLPILDKSFISYNIYLIMYLVNIQTSSGNREFVADSITTVISQFDSTESPKVLIVKTIDFVNDEV